jgi:hypothetical protein
MGVSFEIKKNRKVEGRTGKKLRRDGWGWNEEGKENIKRKQGRKHNGRKQNTPG